MRVETATACNEPAPFRIGTVLAMVICMSEVRTSEVPFIPGGLLGIGLEEILEGAGDGRTP